MLQALITPALCRASFGQVRTTERPQVWTLEALVRFWTAVILRAPAALTQALIDALDEREPLVPRVEASSEAFLQRCRDLRPAFFADVFARVTARLVRAVPPRYAAPLAPVQARFAAVVLLDGSRLAAIAHRLKLLGRIGGSCSQARSWPCTTSGGGSVGPWCSRPMRSAVHWPRRGRP